MKPGPRSALEALLLLKTATSMRFTAVVVVVLELFAATESVSGDVTLTVAVSVSVVLSAVDGATATTRVKLDVVAFALMCTPEFVVQETVPVPPTAGVEQVQPDGGVMETNVVFAGTLCEKVTVCVVAELLRFDSVCVKVTLLPAKTGFDDALFVVTSRSRAQVTCSVLLFVVTLQPPAFEVTTNSAS